MNVIDYNKNSLSVDTIFDFFVKEIHERLSARKAFLVIFKDLITPELKPESDQTLPAPQSEITVENTTCSRGNNKMLLMYDFISSRSFCFIQHTIRLSDNVDFRRIARWHHFSQPDTYCQVIRYTIAVRYF